MDIPQLSLHSRKEAAKEQKDRSLEAANGTPGDIRAGWELGTGTKVVWRLLGIWLSTFMTWVRVPVSLKSNRRQGWEVETWSWWTGINSWRDRWSAVKSIYCSFRGLELGSHWVAPFISTLHGHCIHMYKSTPVLKTMLNLVFYSQYLDDVRNR